MLFTVLREVLHMPQPVLRFGIIAVLPQDKFAVPHKTILSSKLGHVQHFLSCSACKARRFSALCPDVPPTRCLQAQQREVS